MDAKYPSSDKEIPFKTCGLKTSNVGQFQIYINNTRHYTPKISKSIFPVNLDKDRPHSIPFMNQLTVPMMSSVFGLVSKTFCPLNSLYIKSSLKTCDFIATITTYDCETSSPVITSFATILMNHELSKTITSKLYIDVICADLTTKGQGYNLLNFIKYLSCNMKFPAEKEGIKYATNNVALSSVQDKIWYYYSQGFILNPLLYPALKGNYNPATKLYKIVTYKDKWNYLPNAKYKAFLKNIKDKQNKTFFQKSRKIIKSMLGINSPPSPSSSHSLQASFQTEDSKYGMSAEEFNINMNTILDILNGGSDEGLATMVLKQTYTCDDFSKYDANFAIDIPRIKYEPTLHNKDPEHLSPKLLKACEVELTLFLDNFNALSDPSNENKDGILIYLYNIVIGIYKNFPKNVLYKSNSALRLKFTSALKSLSTSGPYVGVRKYFVKFSNYYLDKVNTIDITAGLPPIFAGTTRAGYYYKCIYNCDETNNTFTRKAHTKLLAQTLRKRRASTSSAVDSSPNIDRKCYTLCDSKFTRKFPKSKLPYLKYNKTSQAI